MAIDYKKEWYKFMDLQGHIMTYDGNVKERLRDKMCAYIDNTIQKREKLMEEFIKARIIDTNIVGGNKDFHEVQIIDKRYHTVICSRSINKVDFNAWCKKKGSK